MVLEARIRSVFFFVIEPDGCLRQYIYANIASKRGTCTTISCTSLSSQAHACVFVVPEKPARETAEC